MGKHLHLVWVDEEHFKLSIVKGKTYKSLAPYMQPQEREDMKRWADIDTGLVRVWGSQLGKNNINIPKFRQMQKGDEVMLHHGGKYLAAGIIACLSDNKEVAKQVWGADEDGNTWQLMYYLTGVVFFNIDHKVVNEALGYKPNAMLRGLSKVNDENAARFFARSGNVNNFLAGVTSDIKIASKVEVPY